MAKPKGYRRTHRTNRENNKIDKIKSKRKFEKKQERLKKERELKKNNLAELILKGIDKKNALAQLNKEKKKRKRDDNNNPNDVAQFDADILQEFDEKEVGIKALGDNGPSKKKREILINENFEGEDEVALIERITADRKKGMDKKPDLSTEFIPKKLKRIIEINKMGYKNYVEKEQKAMEEANKKMQKQREQHMLRLKAKEAEEKKKKKQAENGADEEDEEALLQRIREENEKKQTDDKPKPGQKKKIHLPKPGEVDDRIDDWDELAKRREQAKFGEQVEAPPTQLTLPRKAAKKAKPADKLMTEEERERKKKEDDVEKIKQRQMEVMRQKVLENYKLIRQKRIAVSEARRGVGNGASSKKAKSKPQQLRMPVEDL